MLPNREKTIHFSGIFQGMKRKKKRKSGSSHIPKRLSFPEEDSVKWLPMLLDAYHIADRGIAMAIQKRVARGERLACAKGCSTCCATHVTIPVYPLEVVGIYWYVIEKFMGPERKLLRDQLARFKKGSPCPFLMEGACSIHPMRPLACRHFNVFNRPCRPGEDPFYTRRHDVLTPDEKFKARAISAMLPFHGIRERAKRKLAARSGFLDRQVQNLHEIDWNNLALRMDGKKPPLKA